MYSTIVMSSFVKFLILRSFTSHSSSATWEISAALLPHLRTVLSGPDAWQAEPTIGRAVEIQDGQVRNPAILAFQGRAEQYPHRRLADTASA